MNINKFLFTRKTFFTPIMLFLLFLSSCGGGGNDGGSDDNDRNVSGRWLGALTKIEDTCSNPSLQTINFNDNVAQNISAVRLLDINGIEYIGNLVGDNGFSVDATQQIQIQGRACTNARRLEYDNIDNDDDLTSSVDFTIVQNCGSGECRVHYTGTGSRNLPSGNNTSLTPVAGTPIANSTPVGTQNQGCSALNPSPAAGTYSGDGGCGISDVTLRQTTSSGNASIILEPLGVNGSTSFAINSSSPSTASSNRNDLTIANETGYTCSLTCSPPATFTLLCTKEGATTCTEKF